MAVVASWSATNHLQGTFASPSMPFLWHGWAQRATVSVGTLITSAVSSASVDNSFNLYPSVGGGYPTARTRSTVNANALTANAIQAAQWNSIAAAFISSALRESWCNADNANKGSNTGNQSLSGATTVTRIGAWWDGTVSENWQYAELTAWNITGFTEANRDALITRLNTLVGGQIPNAQAVDADVGEPWTGKLLRYWPLTTNSDLSDALESGDDFSVAGTVSTATHPDVEVYSDVDLFVPTTEALYYGATRLDNKTGINYRVTEGHANLNGTLLAQGTNATTNASGVIVWPEAAKIAEVTAADPVTVALYWEEGNPAVDRSIIVKTTLVADE